MPASIELETFIDETILLSAQNGYHPTIFIGMRQRHGTVGAINRLVKSGDIQSGFQKLVELGLTNWTVEMAVTKFPYEFSRDVREAAEWRLNQAKAG
jgi:hypothetical protein